MLILAVTGMPGAGKEEFLNVAKEDGINSVRMGDVVREHYALSDSVANDISVGVFADSERKKFGNNVWAKRTMEKMSGDMFLVDGCRSMAEINAFKELGGDIRIVAIHSPPEIRYDRLVKRGRDDAPKNISEFEVRDAREISWGLGEVVALSNIMIVNSSSLENFRISSKEALRCVIK
jgi:Dephospho-CoA kinase